MNNDQVALRAPSSVGDAAVDGLLHGATASVAMALYLLAAGMIAGTGPVATLSAFDLGQGTSPLRGALIHLAMAAIYGMVFGLVNRFIVRRRSIGRGGSVIIGFLYGLLLWLITQIAFTAGINVALSSLPIVHLAVAHVIYGAVLGWLTGRARME
jgi:uncharacterized membrane protein